jgi:alpha-tubulin suppressor-like RCC1 family protein
MFRAAHQPLTRFLGTFFLGMLVSIGGNPSFGADFDANGIDDVWETSYGFVTNGYASANLKVWSQFDDQDSSKVSNRAASAIHGSLVSGAYSTGLFNSVLSCSSTTFSSFPNTGGVLTATDWTLSVWYSSASTPAALTVARRLDGNAHRYELKVNAAGSVEVQAINSGGTQIVSKASAPTVVTDQYWHQLVIVFSSASKTVSLYVDGDLEAQQILASWLPGTAQALELGSSANPSSFLLDEFRYYNKTLSSTEILYLPITHSDLDLDGLSTLQEFYLGTNPNVRDSDNDGINDGADPLPNQYGTLSITSGLKLWMRADAGISQDVNGGVSGWSDQSSSASHASQSVIANRPAVVLNQLNGKPVVKFDGVSDYLQSVPVSWTGNDYTYFFVWKKDGTPTSTHTVLNRASTFTSAGNNFSFTSASGSTIGKNDAVGGNADASTTNKLSTTFNYISVTRQNSTAKGTKVFINGLIDGQSGTSTSSVLVGTSYPFFIGGWNTTRANASLAEILVYNRNLSPTERGAVEQYLRDRYLFPTPTLPPPVMSPRSGTFVNTATVTLTHPMPGVEIRYTLDGSTPVSSSSLYTAPIVLASTKTVKAIAFLTNYPSSAPVQNTFTVETAAPFTSLVTTGLKFWLASDRGVTLSGTQITSWADQSGLGNTATQGTSSKRPVILNSQINGKPIVKFDGVDDYLMANSYAWLNKDYSYFIVWKKDGDGLVGHTPLARASSLTSLGNHFQLYSANGLSVLKADAYGTEADAISSATYGNDVNYQSVAVTRKDNTASGTKLYVNGALQGQSSATATSNPVGTTGYEFYLGSWGTSHGKLSIAEILVYDRALSDLERQSVSTYLEQRYALVPVATPTFSAEGGVSTFNRNVTINSSTPGAVIHYTTDGRDPTVNDPVIESGSSILIDRSLKLKASVWVGGSVSPIKEAYYTISGAMASGAYYSLGLRSDGMLIGVGRNIEGQLGNGTDNSWSLLSDAAFVKTFFGAPLLSVSTVVAGEFHSLALGGDGRVWSWGANWCDQLGPRYLDGRLAGPVDVLPPIKAIGIGANHSLAIDIFGKVWAWGDNWAGQLGVDNNFSEPQTATPMEMMGGDNVTAVAGGRSHTLALKADGTVWACGWNYYGQLGNGNRSDSRVLQQMAGVNNVTAISAGGDHSMMLKADGTVWTCGENWNGQLGNGNTIHQSIPVQVVGLSDVVAISAGFSHMIALKRDGTVWSWGTNDFGQLGNVEHQSGTSTPVQVFGLDQMISISAGYYHNFAIKTDGSLWEWGKNDDDAENDWQDRHVPEQITKLQLAEGLDDSDKDGILNWQERANGTDPYDPDTDGDQIPDGFEATYGLDPKVNDGSLDKDNDGVDNLTEYLQGRNPVKGAISDSTGAVDLNLFTPLE